MAILEYDFLQRAWLAGLMIAIICPLMGMFVVVRRQSMIGDGLGHLAFAGVTTGHLLGWYPTWGALVMTTLGALAIERVRSVHRQFSDMALALFFYGGIAMAVIFSTLAHVPSANLMAVLFGSILTVTTADVALIAACGSLIIFVMRRIYPQLLLLSLDEDIATVAGVRTRWLNHLFSVLTAVVIVAGMSIVGILMVSALMIVPVATAHLLGRGFRATMVWSIAFAIVAVCGGLLMAVEFDIAPGGTIVLWAILQYIVLLIFSQFKRWGCRAKR